jgi:hypothetical protein
MSARGLLAKPTTRQVIVYICVFLYQGYDILFYREAQCRILFYSVPDCLCFLLYNTHSYVEIICLLSSRQSSVALKEHKAVCDFFGPTANLPIHTNIRQNFQTPS